MPNRVPSRRLPQHVALTCYRCGKPYTIPAKQYRDCIRQAQRLGTPGRFHCSKSCSMSTANTGRARNPQGIGLDSAKANYVRWHVKGKNHD